MIRKDNTEELKQVIERLLKAYGLEERYLQAAIVNNWPTLFGKSIAQRTENLFVKQKTLYVKLNSAPLKQELSYSKSLIILKLNESIGRELINDIVFL